MDIVITNNPLVKENLATNPDRFKYKLEFHDTDCLGIFVAVRNKVHGGHALVTHPLSGSVKPGETPYKTVIVSGKKTSSNAGSIMSDQSIRDLSIHDLSIVEESIQTCVKLNASSVKKEWSESVRRDFQLIDHDLIFGRQASIIVNTNR